MEGRILFSRSNSPYITRKKVLLVHMAHYFAPAGGNSYRDVGGATIWLIGIDQHVDAGRQTGSEGAFERRTNILCALDQFAIAAERLDHLIVANARRQF